MTQTTLTCKACGYSKNELERVYCHECGEKLDRSHLPKKKDTSQEELRRIQKHYGDKTAINELMRWLPPHDF